MSGSIIFNLSSQIKQIFNEPIPSNFEIACNPNPYIAAWIFKKYLLLLDTDANPIFVRRDSTPCVELVPEHGSYICTHVGIELREFSFNDDHKIYETCRIVKAVVQKYFPKYTLFQEKTFPKDIRCLIASFLDQNEHYWFTTPKERFEIEIDQIRHFGHGQQRLLHHYFSNSSKDFEFLEKAKPTLLKLKHLRLEGVTDMSLKILLPWCENLTKLELVWGTCTNLNPLSFLKNLKVLILRKQSTLKDISGLVDCQSITHLELDSFSERFTDTSPINKLKYLQALTLKDLAGVHDINKLSESIEQLTLISVPISDLKPLANCIKLTDVQLQSLSENISDISPLSKIQNLKRCSLIRLYGVSDLSVFESCPRLQSIELKHLSYKLATIKPLGLIKELKECILEGFEWLSDLSPLINCKNLSLLTISTFGSRFTTLEPLAKMTNLKTCSLEILSGINSLSPIKGLPIAKLKLSNIYSLGDLQALLSLDKLKECNIRKLDGVSKNEIEELTTKMSKVRFDID